VTPPTTCRGTSGKTPETRAAEAFAVLTYLRGLSAPKTLLWCYLCWYAFAVAKYFEPSPALWGSSLGLSAIIGTGLYVSTVHAEAQRRSLGFWPVFRFYLMPFCVSSFAALIRGKGFILIFHPNVADNLAALALCAGFCAVVLVVKRVPPARGGVERTAARV
jgi:hypothetical protein